MGFLRSRKIGVQKILFSENSAKELFYKAEKVLLNPVKRTVYVPCEEVKTELLESGYSALAEYSMLNAPSVRCYASEKVSQWNYCMTKDLQDSNSQVTVEMWRYDPRKLSEEKMSGLLLELRRQIAHNRRKAAYEERMRASAQEKPQEVFSQKTKETKPDTEIQPEVQERKVNVVSREDFLLSQIDEFRERAKQLQSLLDSRETEAQELQTLVDERQEKADALGQILEERQKKADGFTAEVEKQIDRLIGKGCGFC